MSRKTSTETLTYASDVLAHLRLLQAERALAYQEGLDGDARYMADLGEEINATSSTYVGLAVTEIAVLRGELGGRPAG